MMKTGKNNRFLASILAASMMLTMSPFAFAAADTAEQKEMTTQEQVQPATQNETNANPTVSQTDGQSTEVKTEGTGIAEAEEPVTPSETQSEIAESGTRLRSSGPRRIIRPADKVTQTYQFYCGESTDPYYTETIQSNDTLKDPGIPSGEGEFLGWYLEDTKLTFDTKTFDKSETFKVTAKFEGVNYFYFMNSTEDDAIVSATKVLHKDDADVTSLADVAIPLDSTHGVAGWYTDKLLRCLMTRRQAAFSCIRIFRKAFGSLTIPMAAATLHRSFSLQMERLLRLLRPEAVTLSPVGSQIPN